MVDARLRAGRHVLENAGLAEYETDKLEEKRAARRRPCCGRRAAAPDQLPL